MRIGLTGILTVSLLVLALASCSVDDSSPPTATITPTSGPTATPTPTPLPTPTPTPTSTPVPPTRISAEALWAERKKNATRFDDNYKGKWVVVHGVVAEVDDGDVRLVVESDPFGMDMSGFGIDTSELNLGLPLLEYIALRDLPREQQAAPDAGQQFEATCKVGNFIGDFGAVMYLNDCHSGQVLQNQ